MYRRIDDFVEDWQGESAATLKVLGALTDASLQQRITGGRTLGRLAWHLTTTLREMLGHAGLEIGEALDENRVPDRAAEIVEAYRRESAALVEALRAGWTDEDLPDQVEMYGDRWAKGKVLSALIRHQCHHRGQMTVLMRAAGLLVPGVSGPAREEWAAWGMASPE